MPWIPAHRTDEEPVILWSTGIRDIPRASTETGWVETSEPSPSPSVLPFDGDFDTIMMI